MTSPAATSSGSSGVDSLTCGVQARRSCQPSTMHTFTIPIVFDTMLERDPSREPRKRARAFSHAIGSVELASTADRLAGLEHQIELLLQERLAIGLRLLVGILPDADRTVARLSSPGYRDLPIEIHRSEIAERRSPTCHSAGGGRRLFSGRRSTSRASRRFCNGLGPPEAATRSATRGHMLHE